MKSEFVRACTGQDPPNAASQQRSDGGFDKSEYIGVSVVPKSFCSGQVIFQEYGSALEEIISFLNNRDFSEFSFYDGEGFALINSEAGEILIEHKESDNVIPEETVRRMLDVLEHIDAHIENAFNWFSHLDLNEDDTLAANLDQQFSQEIYEVSSIKFGDFKDTNSFLVWKRYRIGRQHPIYPRDSFSIEFQYPRSGYFYFNVKFDYKKMLPYELELWRIC